MYINNSDSPKNVHVLSMDITINLITLLPWLLYVVLFTMWYYNYIIIIINTLTDVN